MDFPSRDMPTPQERRREEAAFAKEWLAEMESSGDNPEMLDVYETADGCEVEPDGKCPHGYSSPLLLLGII